MNSRKYGWVTLGITIFTLSSCSHGIEGSGKIISDKRAESGQFQTVLTKLAADCKISIAPISSIEVTGDDNIVPLVKTSIADGTLVVELEEEKGKRARVKPSKPLLITITTPHLQAAKFTGAGSADITGLDEGSFDLTQAGAGNVTVTGKASKASVALTGAGNVNLDGLVSQTAKVSITGAGNVDVDATDSLDATLTGAGNIKVKGHPKKVTKQVTGAGNITLVD